MSPECQGGIFERLPSYSTQQNDIWSLGVILVNLACGRNPWRQACASDETFRAYVQNPDFLRTILPISHTTNHILKGLFSLDPNQRTTLRDLRRQVLAVESFSMSDNELRHAHSAARAAAAAVRPPAVPTPEPSHKMAEEDEYRRFLGLQGGYSDPSYDPHQVLDLPDSLIDTIDFSSRKQKPHQLNPQRQAPPPPIHTPQLVSRRDDYVRNAACSRSSSSSADVSLPPTPEFNPADKGVATGALEQWSLNTKGKGVVLPVLTEPNSPTGARFCLA